MLVSPNAVLPKKAVIYTLKLSVLMILVLSLGCSRSDNTPPPTDPPPTTQLGTVSGSLFVASGTAVDGDTNDPLDPRVENDAISGGGQAVPIPVTIGGYASLPLTQLGKTDVSDIYRVSILGQTSFTLSIGEENLLLNDLDLYLTDTTGSILQESIGTSAFEVIDSGAIAPGDYFIIVDAFDGASNYILSIGVTPASGSTLSSLVANNPGFLSSNADFVPDEIIVKFKNDAVFSKSAAASVMTEFALTKKASSPSGSALMSLSALPNAGPSFQGKVSPGTSQLRYKTEADEKRAHTLFTIKRLRKRADVAYASPNYIRQATAIPNDNAFPFQWHYPLINLPQAWDITQGSDDVIVAVIDTGVLDTHPDISDRILREPGGTVIGFDFISDAERANDGNGIDANPFDSGDSPSNGLQSSFHGTHVAGTIAATTDNSIGVAGVTWLGKIMPLRVLGVGGGTDFDIAQAILYAAGLPNTSQTLPPQKADIINMSIGSANQLCLPLPALSPTLSSAIADAVTEGVTVIVAAGNDNCAVPDPLTITPGVISVGAVDITKNKAFYSNFGSMIDVVAPGGDVRFDRNGDGLPDGVLSTSADDSAATLNFDFQFYNGTSMAAPHMAGVAALMLAVNPTLSPTDINLLLSGTHPDANAEAITEDLGTVGRDDVFGHGLIDAFQAVKVSRNISGGTGGTPPPPNTPVLAVSPQSLNFATSTSSLQMTINNAGTGDLQITEISDDAPWLSIDDTSLPNLTVSVDRTGLSDGTFLGAITIRSNGGDRVVPVFLQVQSASTGGNIGTVFVLALDPESFETLGQAVTFAALNYQYQMLEIPTGDYTIVAGTDINSDGLICGAGEACGIFPLVDSPRRVTVDGNNVTNIDFPTSYPLFSSITTAQTALEKREGQNESKRFVPLGFKRLDRK